MWRFGSTLSTSKVGFALVALWLLLRCALLLTGAEPGEGVRVRIGEDEVAALLFRGDRPAKTLLVATHGGLASKETLLPVCWEARRRGADCVAIDALGHGASSALPSGRDSIASMRKALRVDRTLATSGSATNVRFVGHSMGAYLGCGAVFPCEDSVAMGQGVDCPESRIVWGDVHRSLGLSDSFYLPISHVLEPWTPRVVDTVVDSTLRSQSIGAHGRIALQVALAWLSFFVAAAAGLAFAISVRSTTALSPSLRGLFGAAIVWGALVVGGYRNLWFLLPTQTSDALVVVPIVGVTFLAVSLARVLGLQAPVLGCLLGACVAEFAAVLAAALYPPRALAGILALPIALIAFMAFFVVAGERLSRRSSANALESGLFVSTLLGMFLALLLPGNG